MMMIDFESLTWWQQ